ncbi:hypothetical protein [Streptomyces sp. A012304]|uniref:hypothetical protein n=1 Tax=Streptomyces sp. A012304 TaxID=375446 RepID=UPI00222FFC29|nr:hypothetical protein [Streptomyces sp. A012304]GKQ34694.1 hypothetical protein ALMP_12430 [Streptomyces sp. A012304]
MWPYNCAGVQGLARKLLKASPIENVVIDGEEHPVKLGVFLTDSKTRRAKLAVLGLEWAALTLKLKLKERFVLAGVFGISREVRGLVAVHVGV